MCSGAIGHYWQNDSTSRFLIMAGGGFGDQQVGPGYHQTEPFTSIEDTLTSSSKFRKAFVTGMFCKEGAAFTIGENTHVKLGFGFAIRLQYIDRYPFDQIEHEASSPVIKHTTGPIKYATFDKSFFVTAGINRVRCVAQIGLVTVGPAFLDWFVTSVGMRFVL